MKISALEEYGLRCVLRLARQEKGKPLTLPEISEDEGLSLPYAAKLLMILRQGGLVKSERGRNGGYELVRPASEITLREVLEVLSDPLTTAHHCRKYSGDDANCVHLQDCLVRDVWQTLFNLFSDYLDSVSLEELASGQLRDRSKAKREQYASLTVTPDGD